MAQNIATADGGRTDTNRFTDDVSGDELIEGDRISKSLVARVPGQLGEATQPHHPEGDEPPVTQLVAVTEIDRYDDVHSALLLDPETETFARASRHADSQAWNQKEADWTVREVGTEIDVTDATVDDWGDGDPADDDQAFVQEWVDIVFGDIRAGHLDEYDDRRSLSGTTLALHDEWSGRKATATISLEG